MSDGNIARRYATALIELAEQKKLLDKVGQELEAFSELLKASEELRDLLQNPSVPTKEKRRVFEEIGKEAKFSKVTTNGLKLLLDNQRVDALDGILREYIKALDARKKVLRVTAVSATKLNKTYVMKIRYVLQNMTGKTIEIDTEEDSELIGGIRLHVGGMVVDGTIRTQLHNIEQALLTAH